MDLVRTVFKNNFGALMNHIFVDGHIKFFQMTIANENEHEPDEYEIKLKKIDLNFKCITDIQMLDDDTHVIRQTRVFEDIVEE